MALAHDVEAPLDGPPRPPFAQQTASLSSAPSSPSLKTDLSLNTSEVNLAGDKEKAAPPAPSRRKRLFILAAAIALAVLIIIIVVPVYFTVVKKKDASTSASSGSSDDSSNGGPEATEPVTDGFGNLVITGGDGSEITTEDGSKFTYSNKFGGFWVSDPQDPWNNNARPNSWTPPLNQSWNYATHRMNGVNLGGLFVLEPFISPALFQKYPGTKDEWELSEAMRADTSEGGGIQQLEHHYNTFITEQDIAEIAGAGLNWIRLPVPYWAIDTWESEGEPFLAQTSWKYILRIFAWCRKYGLRIKLDLHTIPGSQNAFNHSGKLGQVNWLEGPMGLANAQRALNYIRIFTEFISQPEYSDVVVMFGIVNEARLSSIGMDSLTSFYLEAHKMIREITGRGKGKGPFIVIGDGFRTLDTWTGFLENSDRIAIDSHPYFAFRETVNTDPIATGTGNGAGGHYPADACRIWGPEIRASRQTFGVTLAGEFSNGFNDCGMFLRGVDGRPKADCSQFDDYRTYSAATKAGLQAFAEASMDALQDWFFWTWKIGEAANGRVMAPFWSYKLGLAEGWMPRDPRDAEGKCARVGEPQDDSPVSFRAWATGGSGAGSIAAASTTAFPWPPASIVRAGMPVTELPTYAMTGVVNTLPAPTFASTGLSGAPTPTPTVDVALDGWFNAQDTALAPTPIPGCQYAPGWDATGASVQSCSA